MTAAYLPRLVCLCLAVFFVIQFAAGLLITLAGPAIVRAVRGMRPKAAAGLLLALRMLPAALALFVVVGLCVPSYLWLEPELGGEEIGAACISAAVLGACLWAGAAVRGARGLLRASQHKSSCIGLGRRTQLAGSHLPVWILDTQAPLFALIGVFRSGVLVSDAVVRALTPAQLDAALRHEEAHFRSRDNLKRLLLLLTPGLLPGIRGYQEIERGWGRFIEWAADDEAVGGDNQRSLCLAAALVRMARMGGSKAIPMGASFLNECGEVTARVDRLLHPAPPVPASQRGPLVWGASFALAAVSVVSMLHPATLAFCHELIEEVIH
ncbi:MAG: M56 family metallopeptidase [Candidatus Solibacter sp.]